MACLICEQGRPLMLPTQRMRATLSGRRRKSCKMTDHCQLASKMSCHAPGDLPMSLHSNCMRVEDGFCLVDMSALYSAVLAALFQSRMHPISDEVLRLMRV